MYGCESWTIKKAERWKIDAFELRCWRRLLRVPWTARRSNQSILKEISPEFSLEGLMFKLKPNTWPLEVKNWLIGKDPDAGKDWSEEEKGTTEDEIVGWHHQPSWHESEQTLGVSDVQRSLACCSPWGCKESDTTELIIQSYINTATELIIRWYIIPFIAQMFPLLATGSSVPWLLCFSCTPVSLWVWGYLFILAHPYFL